MAIINPKPEDDELFKLRQKVNGHPVNAEQDALHLVIGRAITAWSSLEGDVFLCYLIASKPENVEASTAAYHAIVASRTKLEMCNAAMNFYLNNDEELRDEWEAIYKKIGSLLKIRANIAHYTMVTITGKRARTVLRPSMYNINLVKGNTKKKLPKLTIKDIQSNIRQLAELTLDLRAFIDKLNPSGNLKISHNLDWI